MRLPALPEAIALAVFVTGVSAAIWDLRTRRLPNALTFGSAAVAIAFRVVEAGSVRDGYMAGAWSAAGWLVGLLLFFPIYALRGLGAGDVKLLAAFGAWLGPVAVCWVALYGAIAGGILAVPLVIARRAARHTAGNIWGLLAFWRAAGLRPHPSLNLDVPGTLRMPYALPIAIGAVLTVWWRV
jgi:prepilin peptidase CpaA